MKIKRLTAFRTRNVCSQPRRRRRPQSFTPQTARKLTALLPARFVAENLGAKVEWNEENEVVTVTGKNEKDGVVKIVITIGSKTAQVNGGNIELDSPAFIENDRTYTPIRFISEQLGASVEWLESEQKVVIRKK